ncbi:DUF1294 domain-containing protein [Flavobacterium enshiense]|uniref:DUF1294 domain-containing protein n=1 Tax=Flavobacterium enshiense TaxID=1341165 RepID=UPI00345DC7D3
MERLFQEMQPIFTYGLLVNGLAFFANGIDKWLAVHQKRRIPERVLLGMILVGGTVGAGIGMLLFRHKTAKRSYLLLYFGIVILQLACVWFYLKN